MIIEGITPALAQALDKRGYEALTPVQEAVTDPALGAADLLVSAQTGSGKTVAFGLAVAPTLLGEAERFDRPAAPLALIVAPTRELALQVRREFEWLYEMTGAVIASCVGGMDMRAERRALDRGAHIVVGTPGRLRDHIERGSFDGSALRAVVLDEADEMLDLGFREDLEFILDNTPEDRRTLMFSATVSRPIASLAKRYQRDAVRVTTAGESKQHLDIEYRAFLCAPSDREHAVINTLRFYEAGTALVFCGTRATVNHMTSRFSNRGFSAVALSGELSQNERTHALQAMRDGRARVCIATDVAARGIDLPNLDLVVHLDLPRNREALLHRSGRTGRAGRKGVSALIVPFNARRRTERLLQGAGVSAEWGSPPTSDEVRARDDARLLGHPALAAPIAEDEADIVARLLAEHKPEAIAAAFTRVCREGLSAPEELIAEAQAKPARREDFSGGVWISLSVGRKAGAEPRWLLPLLCRTADLTRADIGAIRVQDEESHVELAPAAAARFLEAIGPSRMLEKSIRVAPLDGVPPRAPAGAGRGPSRKPRGPDAWEGGRPAGKPPRKPRPARDEDAGDARPAAKKPRRKKRPARRTDDLGCRRSNRGDRGGPWAPEESPSFTGQGAG